MKLSDIKVGIKVRDYQLKNMGTAGVITELTEKGFKYKIDNPFYVKIGLGEFAEVIEGEVYFTGLAEWEIVPPIMGLSADIIIVDESEFYNKTQNNHENKR